MRCGPDANIVEMLNREAVDRFLDDRQEIRNRAKIQIHKIQTENTQQHNKRCKDAHKYEMGDHVYIKRTQFGTCMKLKPNFLGPYRVTKVNRNERYMVEKEGDGEGPRQTCTSADNMNIYSSIGATE